MSISQTTSQRESSGELACPRCNTPLLPYATFCSACGEHFDKKKDLFMLLQDEEDITSRYRITSLVRRHPHVNLYLAFDNQQSQQEQQRMVAIRDIDITSLQDEERANALELAQQEYDSLRSWQLPHVMPVVDLRYSRGHLYVVADYPEIAGKSRQTQVLAGNDRRLYTLQDFLQSGKGLPSEQRALDWITYLCQALDKLHLHQIVIGDLDPYTIILNRNSEVAQPALMISWMLPRLRALLLSSQVASKTMSYFSAPEALEGQADARSDIYSLGAIFYLLLTGSPPGESARRTRSRLRAPRDLNSRVSPHVNDSVMQALSIEPSDRFQRAWAMAEALHNPRYRLPRKSKRSRSDKGAENTPVGNEGDVETVRIVPLSQKHVAHWQASRQQAAPQNQIPHRPHAPQPVSPAEDVKAIEAEWQRQEPAALASNTPPAAPADEADIESQSMMPGGQVSEKEVQEDTQELPHATRQEEEDAALPTQASPSIPQSAPAWRRRISGLLPAITPGILKKKRDKQAATQPVDAAPRSEASTTWFKQLQLMLMGQRHAIIATAIVESPLRVQPDQVFVIRMHVMGREEPALPPGAKSGDRPVGLSSLVHGDTISIEVRSVLHQSYVYVVQQATVTIPEAGYVAEVTIPMQPLSSAPSGRRDRLQIFFLDGQRRPLYEKPFAIEIFVSHLVKRGHEGHNVLTIPV